MGIWIFFVQGLITLDDAATGVDFTPDGDWVVWKDNEFIPNSFQGMIENGYSAGTGVEGEYPGTEKHRRTGDHSVR